ncbi:MAG: prepilin peptidase [Nanoarchaeota archaeon]
MIGNYFLMGLALVAVVFATFNDLKKREVANWINYSLLGVALIFRFGWALNLGEWDYLFYGFLGVAIMFVIGNLFYYTQAFAGGDAKLLIALGAVFPYGSYLEVAIYDILFIGVLLIVGLFYSLIYSAVLSGMNFGKFSRAFSLQVRKNKWMFLVGWILALLLIIWGEAIIMYLGALIFILPLLFSYLRAVEESCLIMEMKPSELSEGEWLNSDVKIGGKWIRKSVHGLSNEDIKWIRKHGKKVIVRQGIPFVPAFLIAILIMGYVFSLLEKMNLSDLISFVL